MGDMGLSLKYGEALVLLFLSPAGGGESACVVGVDSVEFGADYVEVVAILKCF